MPLRRERALEIGLGGGRLHGAVGGRGFISEERGLRCKGPLVPWRIMLKYPELILLGS